MKDVTAKIDKACAKLRKRFGDKQPSVGLILGSGLGSFADGLKDKVVARSYRLFGLLKIGTIARHERCILTAFAASRAPFSTPSTVRRQPPL